MTSWYAIRFHGAKYHYAPEALRDDVIADLGARGYPLENERNGPPITPTKEWQLDLGGLWLRGSPVRTYRVDSGLAVAVPCAQHAELVGQMDDHAGDRRRFASGREYMKVYGRWSVLVLPPALYVTFWATLLVHADAARAANDAFMAEWKRANPDPGT